MHVVGHNHRRQGLPPFVQIAELENGTEDLRIVQGRPAISNTDGDEISNGLVGRQPNIGIRGGRADHARLIEPSTHAARHVGRRFSPPQGRRRQCANAGAARMARPTCLRAEFQGRATGEARPGSAELHHQILAPVVLREGDDVANAIGACDEHDEAIEAQRDSAMRRRAKAEGLQQMAELVGLLFGGHAERVKELRLQLPLVNSDRCRRRSPRR